MASRKQALQLGKRIAPPRFLLFALLFVTGLAALIPILHWGAGSMAAFDIASIVFLLSIWPLLKKGAAEDMRVMERQHAQDSRTLQNVDLWGTPHRPRS